MAMTKKTLITWSSYEDQFDNPVLNENRNTKLREMYEAGKTDNVFIEISPTVGERHWLDLAAAEEYVAFITDAALQDGSIILSTEIQDYTPPPTP